MPPKKGKGSAAAKPKEGKEVDPSVEHAKAFFKRYAASSAAHGLDELPLPKGDGTAGFARIAVHPEMGCACAPGPSHVRALAEALHGYGHLLTLAFWSVDVRDEGAAIVASYLLTGAARSVQRLELTSCGVGEHGCKVLGEMLVRNVGLHRLNLECNAIGTAGASLLGAGMRVNRAMRELSLAYCGLGPDAAEALVGGAMRNATLEHLELRGNALGPAVVAQVLGAAAKHGSLFHLGLADTGFGIEPEVSAALIGCASTNRGVQEYDLRGCQIGDQTAYRLVQIAKKEGHLIELQLTEHLDKDLFKQALDVAANNRKDWLKKRRKGKRGKKGGKSKKKK